MKKLFLLSLVSLLPLLVSAQVWSQYKIDADELKGTQAKSSNFIEIPEEGAVVLYGRSSILPWMPPHMATNRI